MTPLPPTGSDLEAELQRVVRQLRALSHLSTEASAVVQGMLDRWVAPASAPDLSGRLPTQIADVLATLTHDVRADADSAAMARDLADVRRALN